MDPTVSFDKIRVVGQRNPLAGEAWTHLEKGGIVPLEASSIRSELLW